jgi:hypothetical protein
MSTNEKSFVEFMNDIKNELTELKKSNHELVKKCNENKTRLDAQDDFIENVLCCGHVDFQHNVGHNQKIYNYSFNDINIVCFATCPHSGTEYKYNFNNLHTFVKLETLKLEGDVKCSCVTPCTNDIVCKQASNQHMTKIITTNGQKTNMFNLDDFPSLTDIEFNNNGQITTCVLLTELKSKTHKIKNIKITGCAKIDVVELQSYCALNNMIVSS